MLNPMLERLYKQRQGQYKIVSYGIPNKNRRLTELQMSQIDIEKLDKSDPVQHIIKLAWALGTQLGLRGGEYVLIEVAQITHGIFEDGHPLAGMKWFGLRGISDKTIVLSATNNHLRCDDDFMRSPAIPGDFRCLGGIIERYLPKISPGQTRLFCRVFTEVERENYILSGTWLVFV